jgi:hypothetical protein
MGSLKSEIKIDSSILKKGSGITNGELQLKRDA